MLTEEVPRFEYYYTNNVKNGFCELKQVRKPFFTLPCFIIVSLRVLTVVPKASQKA